MSAETKSLSRVFLDLHAKLHPEGAVMKELLDSGVRASRVLALYPFEFSDWAQELIESVSPSGWNSIQVTASSRSNSWLDSMQQLHRTLAGTLYREHEIFSATPYGIRLRELITQSAVQNGYHELVGRNVSFILFETTAVASQWDELPQMHDWAETESIIRMVLGAIDSAHTEGLLVLAEIAAAQEDFDFNQ